MPEALSPLPEITDDDIDWVRSLMGLDVFDAPRRAFLVSRTTLDVSACPGSGKTTLIVAKLAILARKWPHRTKGICVLSHTNVAREEIQGRLAHTVIGQRLLDYPHFIDTIHGFVNRFLALPWLNSNGYPSSTIDDDITAAVRRRALTQVERVTIETFLANKKSGLDRLRICGRDLRFDLGGKPFPAGPHTSSFGTAKKAVEAAATAGYFCYDEMFVWARALLEDRPDIASWLRRRFPLVLVDEMQDTSELQGTILQSVFSRTSDDVVIQRVGDPNQALFEDADLEPDGADSFPDPDLGRRLDVPNSHRFGHQIAALASPFAISPVSATGLSGIGPKSIAGAPSACGHAIFIFPDNSTEGVLDAYGRHVLTTFGDGALANRLVTAVGAVHKASPDVGPGHGHFPKCVPHYWKGYTAEVSRTQPHPKTLVQYVRAARGTTGETGELAPGVERIASGLARLAGLIGDAGQLKRRPRNHRAITAALASHAIALSSYRQFVKMSLLDLKPMTEASWGAVRAELFTVASCLCDGATDHAKGAEFLAWSMPGPSEIAVAPDLATDAGANIYRVSEVDRHVDIRLGSIHSVKGQTHLATLVLSTYWHKHSSQRTLPWLLGHRVNASGAGAQDRRRLLETYVAMTRPTHMICHAVPRSILEDDAGSLAACIATLSARGWRMAELVNGAPQWLT